MRRRTYLRHNIKILHYVTRGESSRFLPGVSLLPEQIRKKIEHVENLYAELFHVDETLPKPEVDVPRSIFKRNVPFGFIARTRGSVFRSISTEDADDYNQEIDKLYADNKTIAHLIETRTHVVQSKLTI